MSEFENYKQAQLMKFYEEPYIRKFIEKNNFSNSFVANNFNVFNECQKSLEICKNCKGLELCTQKKKGEVVGLTNDGFINNSMIYCKHYLSYEKEQNLIASFVYTDIPEILNNLTLKNIDLDEDEIKQLYGFCELIHVGKRSKGLYIYGDLGVGKTYMCIALANSLIKENKKVSFIKVNDFVSMMSKLIREDVNEYEKLVKSIRSSDYVIMDDIGSETVTEFSRDRLLFNILDYRMENRLTTIFTSNLDKDALLHHYSLEANSIKAKRLLERIDILSDDYLLKGINKRRLEK